MSSTPFEIDKGVHSLRRGRHSAPNQIYHVTTATLWRKKLFVQFDAARAVIASVRRETEACRCDTLCFMLMPDHLHWLMQVRDRSSLAASVNHVKSHSARRINALRGASGRVWQRGFYDRAVRSHEDVAAVARYIVANPLRAGIVDSVREYPFWDAVWVSAKAKK